MGHVFRNWSRSVSFEAKHFVQPRSEAEVVQIIQEARRNGQSVRTQGAGHSFSQVLTTHDTLVSLDQMPQSCIVDSSAPHLVKVGAGMRLETVIQELKDRGLGLRNIGSVTKQSVAGAFSTGTHGTGITLGSLSSQVAEIRLVDGAGEVRTLSSAADLAAGRVNVGMLGIITEVTLQCVPYFELDYNAYLCRFDDVVDRMDELIRDNERALLWWLRPPIGPQDRVLIITKNMPGAPPGFPADEPTMDDWSGIPLPPGGLSFDAGALGMLLLGLPLPAGRFRRIVKYRAGYEDVLTIPLLPVFHRECEYAVPAEKASTSLKEIRRFLDEGDVRLILPIEVRFMAREDHLLSVSRDRPNGVCYIGVTAGVDVMHNGPELFERFEPVMRALGGRPHWGKHFNLTRADLESMYPGSHSDFVKQRRAFDPDGVFQNSLLASLFS